MRFLAGVGRRLEFRAGAGWGRLWVLAAACAALGGCATQRYELVLNNGTVIETKGKPELADDRSVYRYKEVNGRKGSVPVVRVREIVPPDRPE